MLTIEKMMTHFSLKEVVEAIIYLKFSNHEDIGRKEINIQHNGLCNDKNHTYSHIEIFLLTIKRLFEKINYVNINDE